MEVLRLLTTKQIALDTPQYSMSMQIAQHGYAVKGGGYDAGSLSQTISKNLDRYMVMVTKDQKDLPEIYENVKKLRENKNTLIIWAGEENELPEVKQVPVIKLSELQNSKKRLSWKEMCSLSAPLVPAVEEPKAKPTNFFSRMFSQLTNNS